MNQKLPSSANCWSTTASQLRCIRYTTVSLLNLAYIRNSVRVQRKARAVPRDPTFTQLCAGAPKPNRQLPNLVARRPMEAQWMILKLKHRDEPNQESNIQVFRDLDFEERHEPKIMSLVCSSKGKAMISDAQKNAPP
jgi:hypothetical protein